LSIPDIPQLLIITYPREVLLPGQYKELPAETKRVIAVMHDHDHYAVMKLTTSDKKVVVFDGLKHPHLRWIDQIISGLRR
jgi:hypothetical protein